MFKFKIATPEGVVYENNISQVSIPTSTGEITILEHHIPLISVIIPGELKIVDEFGLHILAVANGFLEVQKNNGVVILIDNAERVEEIDVARAEEAQTRAEEDMKHAHQEENIDFARLQAMIDKETNRIRVGRKYKK